MTQDNIGASALKAFAERRVRLEEERDALSEDITAINGEVKSSGYTLKAFNAAIRKLRMTPEKRAQADLFEEETMLYLNAIEEKGE